MKTNRSHERRWLTVKKKKKKNGEYYQGFSKSVVFETGKVYGTCVLGRVGSIYWAH